jgi:hypothetical protein
MTTGALIFAFNNEHVDYEAMARWSADNIERHLGIPTRIITTQDLDPVTGPTRTFQDLPSQVTWYNFNRVDAYRLTPWDRTLLLDADYVVASDQLKPLLELDQDFVAHKTAYDITGKDNFDELNMFGHSRMPMWWATVVMFRRSLHAELIFDCMQMVRNNWDHYCALYGVARSIYRNDYALSIALGIVNGHTLTHGDIPWPLATVTHEHRLTKNSQDHYRVDWIDRDQRPRWININHDFHAMGKGQLGAIIDNHS